MDQQTLKAMYLSTEGRIGRLAYFGYTALLFVAFMVVAFVIGMVGGFAGVIVIFPIYLGVLYWNYHVAAKRFHDLNQPAQYAAYLMLGALAGGILDRIPAIHLIGSLVSLLVLIVSLVLLFVPGTQGSNTYGAPPNGMRISS